MTVTIDLPTEAVEKLEEEAARNGTPLSEVIAQAVFEHLGSDPQTIFDKIAARVPARGYLTDVSREAIYAD